MAVALLIIVVVIGVVDKADDARSGTDVSVERGTAVKVSGCPGRIDEEMALSCALFERAQGQARTTHDKITGSGRLHRRQRTRIWLEEVRKPREVGPLEG